MGLRISWATPAATRPSAASRSAAATWATISSDWRRASDSRCAASFKAPTMRSSSRSPDCGIRGSGLQIMRAQSGLDEGRRAAPTPRSAR